MAEIFFESGVITKTSRDESIVAVTIDGTSKSFIFNKRIFYTFGVQCDGDMTNILEDGTEVDLCYKIPRPGKCACILAVWLGEKPDIPTQETPLKVIYGVNGHVISTVGDYFLVQYEDSKIVCINRGVVYRDGFLLLDDGSLAIDEEISFDAIPFESDHPSGLSYQASCAWFGPKPKVSFQATCAWVGPKPMLIERFDLRSSEYDTGFTGEDDVEGIVAVVPNDVVAIVDVVFESVVIKVLLFRSSFKRRCARIGDMVDVGDSLFMRLGYKCTFPGCRWWYAVNAFKCSNEVIADGDMNLWEEVLVETERIGPCEKTATGVTGSDAGIMENLPLGTTEGTYDSNVNENPLGKFFGSSLKELPTCVLSPFRKKCLSQGRGFILNCVGTLIVKRSLEANIKSKFGTVSFFMGSSPYLSFIFGSNNISRLNNLNVRFNAEFDMSPTRNTGFRAVSVWREHHPSLDPWYWLVSSLNYSDKKVSRFCAGKIESIPLPDSAVAIVDGIPVLVTLQSLVVREEINLKTSSIENYLRVGDEIFAEIEERKIKDGSYYRALQCFVKNSKIEVKPGTHDMKPSRPTTWEDVWKLGELYRKEPIVRKDGKCLVTFVSAKRPVICELDLFEKGNVFVDGKLADLEMLKRYVGQEITFHVAHKHSKDMGGTSIGIFVAYAWIGEEPPPKLVLKEKLAVPKGLVSSPWRYEAVVNSFPLPSHALCYIGYVPVLVLIRDQEGLKYPDLKVGDLLVVAAYENLVEDSYVVLSNDIKNMAKANDIDVNEVYRNLTGCVISVPDPVGKIKVADADFEVSFEFCHLRRVKKKVGVTNKKWLASAITKITVGKQVYFSAVKNKSKHVPYRAFEVYFDE